MKWSIFYFSFIILFFSIGCKLENAKPKPKKELIIVSDYLEAKDSILFSKFASKNDVRVIVKYMKVNNVIGSFRNNKYGVGIDILMMKSLYNVNRLSKNGYFQSISNLSQKLTSISSFVSLKYNYIGFGIDPYVFAYNPDTTLSIRTYGDLKSHLFVTDLSDKQLIPMLAPVLAKMDKVQSFNWIKTFRKHQLNITKRNIDTAMVCLTTLSSFKQNTNTDSLYLKFREVHYPNGNSKGTFYDLRTFAIVDQAENYSLAKDFILFFMKQENSNTLCSKLSIISANETNKPFRLYKDKSEKLLQYYNSIQRIFAKLN